MTSLTRTAPWFISPEASDPLFRYFQPLFFGELAAMLWLLIMGAKGKTAVEAVTA